MLVRSAGSFDDNVWLLMFETSRDKLSATQKQWLILSIKFEKSFRDCVSTQSVCVLCVCVMFLVADDAVVVVKLSSFLCFSWFIWTSILCWRRRWLMHWVCQRQNQSDFESKDHEQSNHGRCRHHGRWYLAVFRRFFSHVSVANIGRLGVCCQSKLSYQRSFSAHVLWWMTIQRGGTHWRGVCDVWRAARWWWLVEWNRHSRSSGAVGGDHLSFGGGVWGEESIFPLRRSAGLRNTYFTPVEECVSKESAVEEVGN